MSVLADLRREMAESIELTLTGQKAPGGQIDVGEIFSVEFTVRHCGEPGDPALQDVRLALTGTSYAEPVAGSGPIDVADRISQGDTASVHVEFEALTALRDYIYKNLKAKSVPPFGYVIQVEEQLLEPTEEFASVKVLAAVDVVSYLRALPVETDLLHFCVQIESPLPPESVGPY